MALLCVAVIVHGKREGAHYLLGSINTLTHMTHCQGKELRMDITAFKNYLSQKNFRLTTQRLAVLNAVVQESGRHLSATEIYEIVRSKHPGIGLATVYKNLRMLAQEGILSKIELLNKTAYYEICDNHSLHCHLICSKCGKIIEVRGEKIQVAMKLLQSDGNFTVQQGPISLYGICEDCIRYSEYTPSKPEGIEHHL